MKSRQPPHSTEAEQGILGCCLMSPREAITEAKANAVDASWFYDLRHQLVWNHIAKLDDAGKPVDVITLMQSLKDSNELHQVGGVAFIAGLSDSVASAVNVGHYIGIAKDKLTLRRLLALCHSAVSKVYASEGEPEAIVDEFEADALKVRTVQCEDDSAASGIVELGALLDRRMTKGMAIEFPTGFVDLDAMTQGLHPVEMTIIAGFPGTGKTALAGNIAETFCISGHAVGMFSMEMPKAQILHRMAASQARVNLRRLHPDDSDRMRAVNDAMRAIARWPLYIDDGGGLTVSEIRAKARRWKSRHNIQLVVVDYIQLVTPPKADTREQEVAKISHGLKAMSAELKIPVVVLSQLNDDGLLRESRAIGQDADGVWRIQEEEILTPDSMVVSVKLIKQRNGPTGAVKLLFRKDFTRFEDSAIKEPQTGKARKPGLPYND